MLSKAALEQLYEGIDLAKDRWSEAIPHHPKSVELMTHLEALDFHFNCDYFRWSVGGDGDNGEILMFLLDIYFERLDRDRD